MEKVFLIFILISLFAASKLTSSIVTVYEGNPRRTKNCTGLFKSVSNGSFYRNAPAYGGSYGIGAETAVFNSRNFVYEAYAKLKNPKNPDSPVNENFISEIKESDEKMPTEQLAYITARNELNDKTEGVLRLVHGGFALMQAHSYPPPPHLLKDFQLPMELKNPLLKGRLSPHKIEIGRLATIEGPHRLAIALEMLTASTEFLFKEADKYYKKKLDAYVFYVETDRVRSLLYRSLGFREKFKPEDIGRADTYILEMSARELYEMTVLGLEKALSTYNPDLRQGDPALALKLIDEARNKVPIKAKDLWTPPLRLRMASLLELGRYEEVIHDADHLIKLNPDDLVARYMRIEAQVRQIYNLNSKAGNAKAAIALIEKEIFSRVLEKHSDILRLLKIRILMREKNFEAVRSEKKLLWDYFPENDNSHFNHFLEIEKDMQNPGKPFDENDFNQMEKPSVDVNQSLILIADYHHHKALVLSMLGKKAMAITEAEIAVGLEPNSAIFNETLKSLHK